MNKKGQLRFSKAWRRLYLREGLIQGMPGWYFTDWDPTDPAAAGREKDYPGPHAVCNSSWNEWRREMAPAHAVTSDAFDSACCFEPAPNCEEIIV